MTRTANYELEEKPYIACINMNFVWYPSIVKKVIQLWNEGVPIWDMADEVKRDVDELSFLIVDLTRKRKIKKRPGGVFGRSVGK